MSSLPALSASPQLVLNPSQLLPSNRGARLARSQRGRWALATGSGVVAVVLAVLASRHFAETSWPLSRGHPGLLVAAGVFSLLGYAGKAYGWHRLFAVDERPQPLALAAANGGASITGLALPGRFDDVVRIAILRRYPGCPAGVRTLCLSLFMLGLIDSAALAPLAAVAALTGDATGMRAGLALVAVTGIAAAALIVALPHLVRGKRLLRFRLGHWLSPRTVSLRHASQAWALVSGCWVVRALQLFLLLGAVGVGFSFQLALLFLCATAAAAALPIGPGRRRHAGRRGRGGADRVRRRCLAGGHRCHRRPGARHPRGRVDPALRSRVPHRPASCLDSGGGTRRALGRQAMSVPRVRAEADPETGRAEFRCSGCGYGLITIGRPPRCPMCQMSAWESVPWRPLTTPELSWALLENLSVSASTSSYNV